MTTIRKPVGGKLVCSSCGVVTKYSVDETQLGMMRIGACIIAFCDVCEKELDLQTGHTAVVFGPLAVEIPYVTGLESKS